MSPQSQQQTAIVGEEYCEGEDRELTVRKTTLFTPGDGLEAYDHRTGALAFRVETYGRGGACGGGAARGDLALLGAQGEPVLTVRRRRPSLHNRWDGFLGDGAAHGQKKPVFSARRSSILGAGTGAAAVLVDLLAPGAAGEFRVDGSFPRRCCRVVASARAWAAPVAKEEEEEEEEGEDLQAEFSPTGSGGGGGSESCVTTESDEDASSSSALLEREREPSQDGDADHDLDATWNAIMRRTRPAPAAPPPAQHQHQHHQPPRTRDPSVGAEEMNRRFDDFIKKNRNSFGRR